MKKLFLTIMAAMMSGMPLMAEGFTDSVKNEGATGLIILAVGFLIILMISIALIPLGYMWAQKLYKQHSENDRDKMSGAKMTLAGVAGAIGGLFVVYAFFGTIGSYLSPELNGDIDFDKGTAYIFQHYIGTALDKAIALI